MKRTYLIILVILVILGSGFHSASAQSGRIVVSALGKNLKETSEIRVLRFVSLKEEALVRVGDSFEAGDELTGTGTIEIELQCPKGAKLKFSKKFRVLLAAPKKDNDCAINLIEGNADILTDRPTSVESGDTTAGSRGTVYSIQVDRGGQEATVWCSVLDGEVDLANKGENQTRVKTGSKKAWSSQGKSQTAPLAADDVKRAAQLYARMDVVKGQIAGSTITASTVADLETSYLRVFQAPSDPEARVELAAKQVNLKVATDAMYHLDHADKAAKSSDKPQLARIAAVRSVVYAETGDVKRASEQAAKAQKIDPKVLDSPSLLKYQIDPKRIPAVRATPAAVRATPAAVRQPAPAAVRQPAPAAAAVTPAPGAARPPAAAATPPAAGARGAAATPAPASPRAIGATAVAALPSNKDLMDLVAKGQYETAEAGFLRRLAVGENARDAYGLALTYSRSKRKADATRYATIALKANEKEKQLTDAEVKTCSEIRDAR